MAKEDAYVATSDPIAEIIGDYRAFAAMQRDRLAARGIDIAPYALSHLAVRVADWDLSVHQRTLLERHARSNLENVWNGRPISLLVLAEPLEVLDGTPVSRIELIPPVHQRVYRIGLEHLDVVVGEEIDEFSRVHRAALTGQQFQSPDVEPVYVLFEDFTHVKFYRRSFFDVVEDEEGRFEGFSHVDDWVPQRLVTATGPDPLPRGVCGDGDRRPCSAWSIDAEEEVDVRRLMDVGLVRRIGAQTMRGKISRCRRRGAARASSTVWFPGRKRARAGRSRLTRCDAGRKCGRREDERRALGRRTSASPKPLCAPRSRTGSTCTGWSCA